MEKINNNQQKINQAYEYAINQIIHGGKHPNDVISELVIEGLAIEDAQAIVANIMHKMHEKQKQKSNKDILYGALWCLGGLLLTWITYDAASKGGTYIVAWGAILFGALQFLKGVFHKYLE